MLSLAVASTQPEEQVGGKARQLGLLIEAGLPVPSGAVIPTTAFQDALRAAGLWGRAADVARTGEGAAALQAAVAALTWTPAQRARLIRAANALGSPVAVRSSGVGEDGDQRSFAGQHLSVIGVDPEDVPSAVLRVWASLYAPEAMAYRGGVGPAPGALAVVLQRIVRPQTAGVLFTINPRNGSWREMVVEAVWGLGEGLVGGHLAPHYFVVRRPRRLPAPVRRVAERVRLHVVEAHVHDLPQRFVMGPGGTAVAEPTPVSLRGRRTLEGTALRRLCRLGLRAERALGGPQDIEWVRDTTGAFRVLQARPITRTGTPRAQSDVVWTRRFIGERWPQPATPLGWSILRPLLEWFIAYPQIQEALLGGGPALRLERGRPYLNTTVFRHLAFKLPGAPPPGFMLELLPPEEERAWRQRFAVRPDWAVYSALVRATLQERRWRRFQWNPLTNPLQWDRFQAALQADLPQLSRRADSPGEAVAQVAEQMERVREYIGIHVCSLLYANVTWQLLESALAVWVPGERELMEGLANCPPGNLTVATNQALHALAAQVGEEDLAALERGEVPDGPVAAFLAAYGHRSEASWELMSPRWRRHPRALVPLLRAQATLDGPSPAARAQAQEDRHRDALARMRAATHGARRTALELLVHATRRYLLLRENQRFWLDHLLGAMQDTVLSLGAQWFADPDDIAYLHLSEVQQLAQGTLTVAAVADRIAARRAQRARDAPLLPPSFLVEDPAIAPAAVTGRLEGLGISPGRVRGRVRVLRSLADSDALRPGEVLVAPAVDPGWTPLFLTAGAVVLELGSVLSHGAVVAREYDVPAVVNIDGVTQRLHDGQEVTVDGHRGLVWVHPEC